MKKKTIFIVVNQGFSARYLLRTDIYKTLFESGHTLVILTTNSEEPYFQKEFQHDHVHVESLRQDQCRSYLKSQKLLRQLRLLRAFFLGDPKQIQSVEDHYLVFKKENAPKNTLKKIKLKLFDFIIHLARKQAWVRNLILKTELKHSQSKIYDDLFSKYQPDLVINTGLGNIGNGLDAFIMKEAIHHQIKTLSIILSWDNPSSKGYLSFKPDHVIVWTEHMKNEVHTCHDYPLDKIFVGGIAHFDIYTHQKGLLTKEELCKKLNLDPHREIILLGTKSPVSYPWNGDMMTILSQFEEMHKLNVPCQIVARIHPIHYSQIDGKLRHGKFLEEYRDLVQKHPYLTLNEPQILSFKLLFDMPTEEMVILASLLKHSKMLINLFSTLSLESALMKKPIINIGFEGDPNKKNTERQNIQIDIDQVHNQRIIETQGVTNCFNQEELLKNINLYLESPDRNAEFRAKIVTQECGPHLGIAGKTIGNHILSLIN